MGGLRGYLGSMGDMRSVLKPSWSQLVVLVLGVDGGS